MKASTKKPTAAAKRQLRKMAAHAANYGMGSDEFVQKQAAIHNLEGTPNAPIWTAATPAPPVKDRRTRAQIIAYYEQRLSRCINERFEEGREFEKNGLKREREAMQMEQLRAVTALLQEASKMMSRAGYLLGKAHKQEGY